MQPILPLGYDETINVRAQPSVCMLITSSSPLSLRSLVPKLVALALGSSGLLAGAALPMLAEIAPSLTRPDVRPGAIAQAEAEPTIVDVASSSDLFSTLVAAVQAAGLVETLSSTGPFTVFAPTNEAFEALPEGVVEALLLPENKDLLTQVLTYHVVEGQAGSGDLSEGELDSLGGSLMVGLDGGKVMINQAEVIRADISASNGLVHVIDQVLVPEGVAAELVSRGLPNDDMEAAEEMEPEMEPEMASEAVSGEMSSEMSSEMSGSVAQDSMESEVIMDGSTAAPVRGLW